MKIKSLFSIGVIISLVACKASQLQQQQEEEFINIEMQVVKGGTFEMGCRLDLDECDQRESPLHTVRVNSFAIAKYELTQRDWLTVMGNNPSEHEECLDCPVNNVSWNDIQVFIGKLNTQTGKKYRLPTEAEWAYAARGGDKSKGYRFSGSNDVDSVAWYQLNAGGKLHPVGGKKPNELGLYDMTGNVWEWCADWLDEDYYTYSPKDNPQGPLEGGIRVIRGGSYSLKESRCRISYRHVFGIPAYQFENIGFRLALDVE